MWDRDKADERVFSDGNVGPDEDDGKIKLGEDTWKLLERLVCSELKGVVAGTFVAAVMFPDGGEDSARDTEDTPVKCNFKSHYPWS